MHLRCETPCAKEVSQRYSRDTTCKKANVGAIPPLRDYLEKVLRDGPLSSVLKTWWRWKSQCCTMAVVFDCPYRSVATSPGPPPPKKKNSIFRDRAVLNYSPHLGSEKTHTKNQTRKQNFHGILPGFWGGFVYVFFSPTRNDPKKTHKQNFATRPIPGQSRKFVYVYVFLFSLSTAKITDQASIISAINQVIN